MAVLPHCDELFERFFDRWYSEDDRKRKMHDATRPDMAQHDGLIGASDDDVSPLTDEWKQEVAKRIDTMERAARGDWQRYLKVSGEIDLAWIDAFDRYYNEARICGVVNRSNADDFSNDYVVLCCEFGAALGFVMRSLRPRLIWRFDWPYWESSLVDPKTGNMIPVFHWAIKKLSDYGWNDGFAQKVEVCLEILDDPN